MIKLKCYDGSTILLNKFSNFNNGSFSNYDTLIAELDIFKNYKITGKTRYVNSSGTHLVDAVGIDGVAISEIYSSSNPAKIRLTKNYSLIFYAKKQTVGTYEYFYFGVNILNELSQKNIFTQYDVGAQCQFRLNEDLNAFLINTITNVTYLDIPRFILSVDSDDISKISKMQLAFVEQNFSNGVWGNVGFNIANGKIDISTNVEMRNFILEMRQADVISEPNSPNIPDIYGDFDNTSDNITLPAIEDINIMSSISSNLVKAYRIDMSNLNDLTSFLWSDNFFDTIKKIQNNPLENIQKLFYLPFDYEVSISENIKIGNVDSNIKGNRIVNQFQEIDFGNIDITEYYGNSLDYNTELSIYLPFIGEKTLNIYDVMASSLNLKYRIDIVTGNCIAIISIVRQQNNVTLNSVLYTYTGDISNNIPLTASQNNFFKQLLGNIASPQSLLMNFGNQSIINGIGGGVSTSYNHTGNISGNNGFMSVLTPYLIVRRPVNVKASKYEEIFGYPAYNSDSLVNQKGFIRFSELYIDNNADISESEKNNLITLLKTDGVYI